jgi:hypothetical protein
MSRKDIISICIVLVAVVMAVSVPLLADHPTAPKPLKADGATPAAETFTTSADRLPAVIEPPPTAAEREALAARQRRARQRRARALAKAELERAQRAQRALVVARARAARGRRARAAASRARARRRATSPPAQAVVQLPEATRKPSVTPRRTTPPPPPPPPPAPSKSFDDSG